MIIGLDMGGTHIDGVIVSNGKIINTIKKPRDRDDLFSSIWTTIQELLVGYDKSKIERINLSTTISTNAIVENKVSAVGMIIQSGPGLNNDFLECGDENRFISGYVDHRGIVVEDLDLEDIYKAIDTFKNKDIQSCAVVTKFSTRNPSNEIKIKEKLKDDFSHITLGHSMSGKLNFPRRVFTSYLNSSVYNTFKDFSESIKSSLEKEGIYAPVYILKADGGTMDIQTAEEKPVETILSGPAASLMGLSAMSNINDDGILLDIGGTTTDIFFLADGIPLFEPLGIKISKYNTLVRAIYSVSIGLGGDSSIDIKNDKIVIGPERKGKPYAFGGPKPTPTDAMICLELIDIDNETIIARSKEAMESLGKDLNLSCIDISMKILETMGQMIKSKTDELLLEINSKPVYTVKELLYGKKIQPKSINIIGGPANTLSPFIEKVYNLPCNYPKNYHIANAIGAALAKPTIEISMVADTSQGILSVPELGVYEKIPNNYTLGQAKERAIELLNNTVISMGSREDEVEIEITEENCFNMVRGFYTTGKNIRIKAQLKPDILKFRGVDNDDSKK